MLFEVKLKFGYFFIILLSLAGFTSCEDDVQKQIDDRKALDDQEIQAYMTANNITNAQRQASGLYYVPQTPGTGNTIQKGNSVSMHYITRDVYGNKFESTYDTGRPRLVSKVGSGEVIKGWDEGLQLMKLKETATLIIPSYLGSNNGYTRDITRIMEITVLEVK